MEPKSHVFPALKADSLPTEPSGFQFISFSWPQDPLDKLLNVCSWMAQMLHNHNRSKFNIQVSQFSPSPNRVPLILKNVIPHVNLHVFSVQSYSKCHCCPYPCFHQEHSVLKCLSYPIPLFEMFTSFLLVYLLDYRTYAKMVPDSSLIFYWAFLIRSQNYLSNPNTVMLFIYYTPFSGSSIPKQ